MNEKNGELKLRVVRQTLGSCRTSKELRIVDAADRDYVSEVVREALGKSSVW